MTRIFLRGLEFLIFLFVSTEQTSRENRLVYDKWFCPPSCVTCSAVNGCVTCRDGFLLVLQRNGLRQTGSCVEECPKGYYSNPRSHYSRCFHCAQPYCERCSDYTSCDVCTPPYLLHRGRCIENCPSGLVYKAELQRCAIDDSNCPVGAWTEWSTCEREGQTCGYKYGVSWRTRHVMLTNEAPVVMSCPVLSQYRKCRLEKRHCPFDPNKSPENLSKHEKRRWRKRIRRKRKKCISRGKTWRAGECVRKFKKSDTDLSSNAETDSSTDTSTSLDAPPTSLDAPPTSLDAPPISRNVVVVKHVNSKAHSIPKQNSLPFPNLKK